MKKAIWITLGILAGVVVLGIGGYTVYQNVHYGDRWYPGTSINGVDVAGETLEESKNKMLELYQDYKLDIKGRDDGSLTISGDDIDFSINMASQWDELFEKQHQNFLMPFSKVGESTIGYDVSYDEAKLENCLDQSEIVRGSSTYKIQNPVSAHAEFVKEKNQYASVAEINGNKLQQPAFSEAVKEALRQGRVEMDLTDGQQYPDVYEKPEITSEDEDLNSQVSLCNNAALRFISWNMGEGVKEQITPENIAKWITYKNGKIVYNNKAVEKWVEKFCLKYKTVGKTRRFKSHTGKKVAVAGGDYGWQMDYDKTVKQAKKALKQNIDSAKTEAYISDPSGANKKGITISNKPVYLNTAFKKDYVDFVNDWDTKNYTEVSLSEQMVYVFRKGKVAFSCRCISGLPVEGRETTTGAFFIKEHRQNYTMVGEDYKTFVEYWVRITWTGTGFHPANWQPWSRWSKDLYKTNGSHGCLNLEPSDAKRIYDMLDYREIVFLHR